MKIITTTDIKTFINNIGIAYSATQTKLCVPIINRICQKMAYGIKFDDIKICDNLIIDGHHRYLSSLLMNIQVGSVSSSKTTATVVTNWLDIEFDEADWDTESKILHLNEQDAKYNGIDIEILKQLTKKH